LSQTPEFGPAFPPRVDGKGRHAASEPRPKRRWLLRIGIAFGALVVLAGVGVMILHQLGKPSVSVSSTSSTLLDVHVAGLGTKLSSVSATSNGQDVALVKSAGGLVPAAQLAQGQQVTVTASAKSPSWLSWLVGSKVSVTKKLRTAVTSPAAKVSLATTPGQVPVAFSGLVSVVQYSLNGGPEETVHLAKPATIAEVPVPSSESAGSLTVAGSPQEWETVDPQPSAITWFVPPASGDPVALVEPSPGSVNAASNGQITMVFDEPVSTVLRGGSHPTLSPNVPGKWSQPDADTLIFTPSGFGYGPGATVTVSFNRPVATIGAAIGSATTASATTTADAYTFSVQQASLLRMEQILAQLHYLPLNFTPAAGATLPTTYAGEVAAMTNPVPGSFSWRWASTPASLQSEWAVGAPNTMLKGALMTFDAQVNSTYDGYNVVEESVADLATTSMWQELLQAAAANHVDPNPYSYVYVTENLPETLTLWQNGADLMSVLANTGIPQDPTATGTYPIYVRYTHNWMNGTNPDGSKYHDLVYWINYFNGSDAVHGFIRPSYGHPQSLGCVELPIPTAEQVFNMLTIGDLVTVAG